MNTSQSFLVFLRTCEDKVLLTELLDKYIEDERVKKKIRAEFWLEMEKREAIRLANDIEDALTEVSMTDLAKEAFGTMFKPHYHIRLITRALRGEVIPKDETEQLKKAAIKLKPPLEAPF